jgi:Flp pilus assembly protein TadD/mono/diheme cytochrome c family protein
MTAAAAGYGTRLAIVACLAVSAAHCARPSSDRAHPTYTTDIAPILFEHCAGCHRPGQSAPFSLLKYADVQPRASLIAGAVRSRLMPPWLPDHLDPAFVGERRLTDAQIALIEQWAQSGAAEGDPRALPAPPVISTTWQLGPPDLTASPPRAYTLQPGGHDVYRNLVIRLAVPGTRYVRAMEFMPGDAPVHHAVIRIDKQRLSRADDGVDGQPGFDGMAATGVQDPDGHFLGWAPGRGPITAPDDLPWVLSEGSDLVIELHLMPGANPVDVQPTVGLFFTDRAPAKSPVMMVMGSKAIDIPAGATDYTIEDRYTLPVDVEVLSVYPHAHYLGREMDARAVAPDGTTRPLIHIRQWSFNWQQDYRFVTPIALRKGTTIVMRYSYDNSSGNKNNPNQPPRRVTWGPQSHDEMGNLGVQVVTRSPDDSVTLAESFARHAALIDVAGGEALVKADPQSASHAAFLGISYVRTGRLADAIPQLERALRLEPRSATTENYLAGTLLALGNGRAALAHFRRAAALAPRDAHLHFNLAKVLADSGQPQEAFVEFRRALALNPDFAEAHQQVGVLLFSANRLAEALPHLQRAVELLPASADAHGDLGGALAEAGRRDEAVAHLRRALALDPRHQTARENLARLEQLKPH